MTPTPQQIIELAREATAPEWFDDGASGWHMGLDLKKFATLLLERFGQAPAVQQEPACDRPNDQIFNSVEFDRIRSSATPQPAVQQEPVAFAIEAGICEMRVAGVHLKREAAEAWASEIKSATRVRPLVFGDTHPTPAEVREPLSETEQIDAAMVATSHIFPPITRSQCQLIIRAAHGITGSKK